MSDALRRTDEEDPQQVARNIHEALVFLWTEATRAGLVNVPDALWAAAKMAEREASSRVA